jgi:hypothetical protein
MIRGRDDFFSLGMWGYRNYGNSDEERARDTSKAFRDHLFNTHMAMAGGQTGFLGSAEGLKMLEEMGIRFRGRHPRKDNIRHHNIYARFLMDEPDAHDDAVDGVPGHLRVGSFGQGLVERQEEWTHTDPRNLSILNIDLTYTPENWLTYGQIPDILAADPYYQNRIKDVYNKHPGQLGQFCAPLYVFGISDIVRWSAEPNPSHILLNSCSSRNEGNTFRYGTPEEKRIEFYYALATGAKGISYWWFTPYGKCFGCGSEEPEAKAMMRELARLNAEARSLEPMLALSCPAAVSGTSRDPFAPLAAPPWLFPRTLFVGQDTAIIILVNRDHACVKSGTIYQPLPNARVHFDCPPWMEMKDIFRLTRDGVKQIANVREENKLSVIEMKEFDLTEMLIITQDPSLKSQVQSKYKSLMKTYSKAMETK